MKKAYGKSLCLKKRALNCISLGETQKFITDFKNH